METITQAVFQDEDTELERLKANIYITRAFLPPFHEYIKEIRELWDSHWITNIGRKHAAFQRQLCSFMGVDRIALLTNGHMALELSIEALGLTGEVITTPFTFASTTHAIVRKGLTPVFCDIRPDDYTIDADRIEELITERTSAILPVHVYGNLCQSEKIKEIARKHDLKVIYDAAHAFGEEWMGRSVGLMGDASCFSFHATKVFNSIEGGAVVFADEYYDRKLQQLLNFGIRDAEHVDQAGSNAKMNEFCAAMGICNLRYLESEIQKRQNIDRMYRERLTGVEGLQLNPVQPLKKSNYAYFPVLIDETLFGADRNSIADILAANDIYVRKYFYPLTSAMECYGNRFDPEQTPSALYASTHILTLPMYGDLTEGEVDRICSILLQTRAGKRADAPFFLSAH